MSADLSPTGRGEEKHHLDSRCGFGSKETMCRSFLRLLATTRQDYRSRFSA
jgi:hypothetical protein